MFKKTTFTTTLFIAFFCCGWLFKFVYITPSDRIQYEAMRSKERAIAHASQDKETRQHRAGVQKDLWLAQEDKTRLHHKIASKTSLLTLLPIDDKVDIIEHLEQLQCWMQDKLYVQDQQIRFFEADTGIYQYSTQRFAANSVALALFRLPGSHLPSSTHQYAPFLRGIAQNVSFSIAGKGAQFQAEQFKATLAEKKS